MAVDLNNEAQKMMLNLISRVQDETELQEIKKLISDYFANKAQKEIDALWESGALNQSKLDSICQQHNRTAYIS